VLTRVLEPEVMDSVEEAEAYDAMDHVAVNDRFVADFFEAHGAGRGGQVLDVGMGPGRIAIALCRADPRIRVLGIDLAESMLELARRNVEQAGLAGRIRAERADAKACAYPDGAFEAVVSNTIIHHIPDPGPALAEMTRLVGPGGTVFVRDLARPGRREELEQLVAIHAGGEPPATRALFEASLQAALTPEEVRATLRDRGLDDPDVVMTSDRHWTWKWTRPR
jgi:ubiquinone/menaquinone biosynthesis C-methylase UbiE